MSLMLSLTTRVAEKAPSRELPISPLEGEMSGRTEGGSRELGLARQLTAHYT
jgi:hypothetical protein